MRLTSTIRDAFVRAVMDDVPKVDYEKQRLDLVQQAAYLQMPPILRDAFDNRTLNPHLLRTYKCVNGDSYYVVQENFEPTPNTIAALIDLEALEDAQATAHSDLKRKLKAAIGSVATVKAAVKIMPEFAKYLPSPDAPTPNLPSVTNLVADLSKAGWPKGEQHGA